MMPSHLVIALLLPAMVSAGLLQTIASCIGFDCGEKGSKVPAPDANPQEHHKEDNPYMLIAEEVGEVWSKLLKIRVLSDDRNFEGSLWGTARILEELADEISKHYNTNLGNMKDKAKSLNAALNVIHSRKLHLDSLPIPADSRITEYVNEMIEMSKEIEKKVHALSDAKLAKKENQKGIENGN